MPQGHGHKAQPQTVEGQRFQGGHLKHGLPEYGLIQRVGQQDQKAAQNGAGDQRFSQSRDQPAEKICQQHPAEKQRQRDYKTPDFNVPETCFTCHGSKYLTCLFTQL